VIRASIADGWIQAKVIDPTAKFSNNVAVNPAFTNITILQSSAFQPPICSNLGDIPILSDLGCMCAFVLWLTGLSKLTTEFVWLNYLILVPLGIICGFAIIRIIKP